MLSSVKRNLIFFKIIISNWQGKKFDAYNSKVLVLFVFVYALRQINPLKQMARFFRKRVRGRGTALGERGEKGEVLWMGL